MPIMGNPDVIIADPSWKYNDEMELEMGIIQFG